MAQQALRNQMTRSVKVERLRLIETLKANRARHLTQYNEAMDGYKSMALERIEIAFSGIHKKIDARKEELIAKINTFSPETADQFSDNFIIFQGEHIPLEVPRSYIEAYDAAIDMFEFDVRPELELSGAEFQCFCRDVWDWSYEFTETLKTYVGSKAR